MKKVALLLTVMLLVSALLACSMGVCAERYKASVVSDNFTDASKTLFLLPGDMNADGVANANDLPILINILLRSETTDYSAICSGELTGSIYSDTNGDESVNILDLVRAKKNIANASDFVSNGSLNVNGRSIYSGEINANMSAGVTYTVTYKYKTTSALKFKLNLQGDVDVRNYGPSDSWQTVSYDVTVPLTKVVPEGIEAQIIGVGQVDDFSIKANIDNELAAS